MTVIREKVTALRAERLRTCVLIRHMVERYGEDATLALIEGALAFETALPSRFDGFTVPHISDLHVDINERAMHRLTELLPGLDYVLCVLTGDYRGATFGAFDAALEGLARVRSNIS